MDNEEVKSTSQYPYPYPPAREGALLDFTRMQLTLPPIVENRVIVTPSQITERHRKSLEEARESRGKIKKVVQELKKERVTSLKGYKRKLEERKDPFKSNTRKARGRGRALEIKHTPR